MDIRIVTDKDVTEFWKLRLRSMKEHPHAFLSSYEENKETPIENITARLKPTSDAFVIGAFDIEEGLIGFVGLKRQEPMKIKHKAMIWGMYVMPEYQGKGIAASLLSNLIDRAKQIEGLEMLVLSVIIPNLSAQKLYDRLGFILYGTEPNALKIQGQRYNEEHRALQLRS